MPKEETVLLLEYARGIENGRRQGKIDGDSLRPFNKKTPKEKSKTYQTAYEKAYQESYYFALKLQENQRHSRSSLQSA